MGLETPLEIPKFAREDLVVRASFPPVPLLGSGLFLLTEDTLSLFIRVKSGTFKPIPLSFYSVCPNMVKMLQAQTAGNAETWPWLPNCSPTHNHIVLHFPPLLPLHTQPKPLPSPHSRSDLPYTGISTSQIEWPSSYKHFTMTKLLLILLHSLAPGGSDLAAASVQP